MLTSTTPAANARVFAIDSRREQVFCHVHGKRPHADRLGSEADAVEFEHVGFDEVGHA